VQLNVQVCHADASPLDHYQPSLCYSPYSLFNYFFLIAHKRKAHHMRAVKTVHCEMCTIYREQCSEYAQFALLCRLWCVSSGLSVQQVCYVHTHNAHHAQSLQMPLGIASSMSCTFLCMCATYKGTAECSAACRSAHVHGGKCNRMLIGTVLPQLVWKPTFLHLVFSQHLVFFFVSQPSLLAAVAFG
jgi:hypothetical protein